PLAVPVALGWPQPVEPLALEALCAPWLHDAVLPPFDARVSDPHPDAGPERDDCPDDAKRHGRRFCPFPPSPSSCACSRCGAAITPSTSVSRRLNEIGLPFASVIRPPASSTSSTPAHRSHSLRRPRVIYPAARPAATSASL